MAAFEQHLFLFPRSKRMISRHRRKYDAMRFITRIVKSNKSEPTIDDGPYILGKDGESGTAPFMQLAPVMRLNPDGLDAQSIWGHGYTGILRGPVHSTEELERYIAFKE